MSAGSEIPARSTESQCRTVLGYCCQQEIRNSVSPDSTKSRMARATSTSSGMRRPRVANFDPRASPRGNEASKPIIEMISSILIAEASPDLDKSRRTAAAVANDTVPQVRKVFSYRRRLARRRNVRAAAWGLTGGGRAPNGTMWIVTFGRSVVIGHIPSWMGPRTIKANGQIVGQKLTDAGMVTAPVTARDDCFPMSKNPPGRP